MYNNSTLCITGTTGLVGGMLAIKALTNGCRIRCLLRDGDGHSAKDRLHATLSGLGLSEEQWQAAHGRIEIIEGDITRPRFGLVADKWQQLSRGLTAVLHAAAYTGFDPSQAAKSAAVNIDGTRHVLKLAKESGARLLHVSTAYVVGDTEEQVYEVPLQGKFRWKNPYEKTKYFAEQEVHAYCREHDISYAVFRPAILVGGSNGRTIRFNNIYNFIRVAHMLARKRSRDTVIIEARPEARLNIVPVDFAVAAIWQIFANPNSSGRIFHIANPSPPTFLQLVEAYSAILDLEIRCVDPHGDGPALTVNGRKIGAAFSEYGNYMFGEPRFDLSESRKLLPEYNTLFPGLDQAYYQRILDYAVQQKWGARQQTALPRKTMAANSSYTDRYFLEFLATKKNQLLIANLTNLHGVIAIRFRDRTGPDWLLELQGGVLISIGRDTPAEAECTYVTDTATFEAVASGRMPPERAFFDGHADIIGNIEKGLQVITALAEFFRTFPFAPPGHSAPDRRETI